MTQFKAPTTVVLAALLLGWSVDYLFYGKQVGLSFPIFIYLATAALYLIGRGEGKRPLRQTLWLLPPLAFFASMVFVRANGFLTTMNILAALALLSYITFFYARGCFTSLGIVDSWLLPFRLAGLSFVAAAPIVKETVDMQVVRKQGGRNLLPLLRGGVLALPLLGLFTLLLSSADLVFAEYVDAAISLEIFDHLWQKGWRGIIILGTAWIFTGGFAVALGREKGANQSQLARAIARIPQVVSLGLVESSVILILIDLLFLGFTAVQFTYLFGGVRTLEIVGISYADYARQGFFELVTVAILSFALVLGLRWLTRRRKWGHDKLFNGLATVNYLLVGVMLASAFYRMRLYEAAFGYTELRLLVYLFIGWLAVLLGWSLIALWLRPYRFAPGVIVCAIGFLATFNLINPDEFIVRQNMARYHKTGDLDAAYLTQLSADAVPALIMALAEVAADPQEVLTPACDHLWRSSEYSRDADCYATPAKILQTELNGRYTHRQTDSPWQSIHLARWRAWGAVQMTPELLADLP